MEKYFPGIVSEAKETRMNTDETGKEMVSQQRKIQPIKYLKKYNTIIQENKNLIEEVN